MGVRSVLQSARVLAASGALIVAAIGLAACGGDDALTVTCNLEADGGSSSVQLSSAEGSTAYSDVSDYRITFTMLSSQGIRAEVMVRDTGERLVTSESNGPVAGGSAATLSWSCSV